MDRSHIATEQITPGTRPKRAIIFARARSVPPDQEHDEAQLAAQILACREVATRLGAEVASEHWAVAGSGELGTRIVIDGMLEELAENEVGYLIVQSWDRLARRPGELACIATRLATAGTQLVTTADPREAFLQDVKLFCLVAKVNERRSA